MDFSKFFTKAANRRRTSILRQWAKQYLRTPNAITLANGMPNDATFPFKEIMITYKDNTKNSLIGQELGRSLQYGPSNGFPPLVEKFREFQERYHQPKHDQWNVIFTCGSQDGCSKIFEMIIEEGDPIMIQSPVYTGIITAIAALDPEFIDVTQDTDGIIPEEIERICEKKLEEKKPVPKLLYVNPTGANPTGTVLPESRRRTIYQLARKYNFLIVEDDPYYFLHFLKEVPPTFFSLDTDGRVLRLDSFSKIMSSGIRLGVVTAHKDLLIKLINHTECSIIHPSSLSQMLVYKMFESWSPEKFDKHFKGIQNFYRERRDIMLKAMDKHLSGLAEWTVPKAGMFFWVKVKGLEDVFDLVREKCVEQKLFVMPGHAFHYNMDMQNAYLRLCYSYATPEEMDKALSILAKLIKEEIAKQNSR